MTASEASGPGAAIILAGGKSTRLGRDKASEVLLGRSLLQRALEPFMGLVDEYVVVCARGQTLPDLSALGRDFTVVDDIYPEAGPLGGIYSGLSAIEASYAVVVACDMPLLQPPLLRELLRLGAGQNLVVPLNQGNPEPLCAAYSKACLEPIRGLLEAGAFKVSGIYDKCSPMCLSPCQWHPFDADGRSFQNLNREADLMHIRSILQAMSSDT